MGDRMTIDELEVIFQSPKPFLDSQPYDLVPLPTDGFQVVWPDGHIDNMPGQWVETNNIQLAQWIQVNVTGNVIDRFNRFRSGVNWNAYWFKGTSSASWVNRMMSPVIRVYVGENPGNPALKYVFCDCHHDPQANNQSLPQVDRLEVRTCNVSFDWYKVIVITSWSVQNYGGGGELGYEVRNDQDNVVFRVSATPPTIIPNEGNQCELTLNFDDGSNLFFGTVPCDADIEIFECFECPSAIPIANEILAKLK